jgi:Flagellar filament outer layer protein Flaa
MKLRYILLVMLVALYTSTVSAQPATQPAAQPAAKPAQSGAQNTSGDALERVTLDDFEDSEDWRAKSTNPVGETKTLKLIQRGIIKDVFDEKSAPDSKNDKGEYAPASPEQAEKIGKNHVLGVKTFFYNRGFDRVEVSPPQEYIIRGKARQISVWVLGRKYRHTLYAKFRDYKGNTHNIRLGRLDFFGWRKLTAPIPGFLPQSARYSLLDKNIHFVSLFVASDVHEVGGDFYFYMDDLEVRTDRQESIYPGFEIKDNW